MLIKGLLKNTNVDVLCAEDGFEAIEMAAGEHPDLIIMDYYMPGLNGYETAKAIKGKTESMPIICHTTDTATIDNKKNRSVFNDFIFKPVNKHLLLKKISHYIG